MNRSAIVELNPYNCSSIHCEREFNIVGQRCAHGRERRCNVQRVSARRRARIAPCATTSTATAGRQCRHPEYDKEEQSRSQSSSLRRISGLAGTIRRQPQPLPTAQSIPVMVRVALPIFCRVTVCGALVEPS